jgi:hypothetical protein
MITRKIQVETKAFEYAAQKTIRLLVNASNIKELSMPLVLLKERLADALEISCDGFTFYLRMDLKRNESICTLFDIRKEMFKGSISAVSLEFLLFFLLKYYRDDTAGVDHIDLDFKYEKNVVVTLTVQVENATSISADEVNKLLNL